MLEIDRAIDIIINEIEVRDIEIVYLKENCQTPKRGENEMFSVWISKSRRDNVERGYLSSVS